MSTPALVIAAHGTRVAAGVEHCDKLVELVRDALPGVEVAAGYVELVEPPINRAVASALADHDHAVVVPLMVGTGAHVQVDIPREVAEGAPTQPGRVVQTPHLGAHRLLLDAVAERIASAMGEGEQWTPADTTVVLVGRGSLVSQANADHCALARLLLEAHRFADVLPCFIQVTEPSLPHALDRALATGAKRIIVAQNFLFSGRLEGWVADQTNVWTAAHPEIPLRLAGIIGPCQQLAQVVAERYLAAAGELAARAVQGPAAGSPVYLSGLDLAGRRVLVAGAGAVAARRVTKLVDAGALVEVVAPNAHPSIVELASAGRLVWQQRPATADDVTDAWYVLAATDQPETNALLAETAAAQRIFCVRADAARAGTAWTPATERVGDFTVGVVGNRDPRGSAALRDRVIACLRDETPDEKA